MDMMMTPDEYEAFERNRQEEERIIKMRIKRDGWPNSALKLLEIERRIVERIAKQEGYKKPPTLQDDES